MNYELANRPHEARRVRSGLICLMLGVFLLLWVWMMIMLASLRTPADTLDGVAAQAPSRVKIVDESDIRRIRAAPLMLATGAALVLVFVLSSYVLLRGMRRAAADLSSRRSRPTPTSDVWSMHVLPGERALPRRPEGG